VHRTLERQHGNDLPRVVLGTFLRREVQRCP
jgi:hypothetical protein